MILTIGEHGINWIWYLCGDFSASGTVHVHYYQRWHKGEPGHPKGAKFYSVYPQFTEDGDRTLVSITVDGKTYRVTNPQYIFNYKDMTHYVPE